ncbi:hypothetical protein [Criblamydia sequanensis]|uniref:Uncharacterized protein n=1 Tax=Candidatus Criblamydia sequanensis CRIB-18 TaxID=1437425 RepID=A0A090CYA0_9BACT|nr:hypothetical protein [Criblamydia sequanensis]CDR33447.1 hypothetical protein CSEC_0614 [Criblamydia sequanensis CRIB-18]
MNNSPVGPSEQKPPATPEDRFERYVERVTAYAGREIENISSKNEPKLVPLEKDSAKKVAKDKTENFSSNVFKMLGNYFLLSNEKRLKPETKEALSNAAVDVKNSGHTLLGSFIKTVQAGIDKLNSWRFKEEISSPLEDDWIEVPGELKERNPPPKIEKHVRFKDEEKEDTSSKEKTEESGKGIQPKPGPVQGAITRGGTPVIPQSNRGFADLSGLGSVPAPDYIEEEEEKEIPPPLKDAGLDVNPYDNEEDWLTGKDEPIKDEGKITVREEAINPKEEEDWFLESDEEEWKEEAPETREQSKDVIKPKPGQVEGAVSRGGTVIPEKPGGTGLAELLNIPLDKDEPPVQDYDVEEKTEKPPFTSGNIISKRVPEKKEGLGLGGLTETQENKGASAEPEKPAKDSPNRPGSIFSRTRFPRNPSIVKKAFEQPEKVEKEKENNDKEKGEIV